MAEGRLLVLPTVHVAMLGDPIVDQPAEAFIRLLHAGDLSGQLCADPGLADLILFTQAHMLADWTLGQILDHPLHRSFGDRCVAYDERDHPWCAMPGLYVSMPRSEFVRDYQEPWPYYGGVSAHRFDPDTSTDLLFSFVGSRSHASREPVFQLRHPRGLVEDTTGFVFFDDGDANWSSRRASFDHIISRSKYVLCPRGRGTSSIRSYEVLAAGRVPVIISDEWVEPSGASWATCSLRVKEADVADIPALLERHEPEWTAMAAAASANHADFYAPEVMGRRALEAMLRVQRSGFPRDGIRDRRFHSYRIQTALRSRIGSSKFARRVIDQAKARRG